MPELKKHAKQLGTSSYSSLIKDKVVAKLEHHPERQPAEGTRHADAVTLLRPALLQLSNDRSRSPLAHTSPQRQADPSRS